MDTKNVIGTNVRTYRKSLGWTQEKLAVRAGLSFEYICRLEKGRKNPGADTIVKLATALKIKPGLLFEEEN